METKKKRKRGSLKASRPQKQRSKNALGFSIRLKTPERQCISCRKSSLKKDLIRIVYEESGFYFDFIQEAKGRALYVHPSAACLKEKQFDVSFNKAVRKAVHEKKSFVGMVSASESDDANIQVANLQTLFEIGRKKISQMINADDSQSEATEGHGKKNKKYKWAKACIEQVEYILNQVEQTNTSVVANKKRIRL